MSDMIKIRKKDYRKEKVQEIYDNNIDHQLASSGGFSCYGIEGNWRGKTKKNYLSMTEQNYEINEIIKKYKSNKNEIKGFSSKYILQLSDLLGQKDKNFSKKRLELYKNRINRKNENKKIDKNNEQDFKTLSVNSKLERMFKSKKSDTVTMFCSSTYKKTKSKKLKNKKSCETLNNELSIKSKSLKSLLSSDDNKRLFKNKSKEAQSVLLTQIYGNKKEDNIYDNSFGGKEEFLLSGNKEKYQEYLKKEYNFYNNDNLNQVLFLYAKNKRIELFKNVKNYKFLKPKKNAADRNNLINKILREKNNNDFELPKIAFRARKNKKMNFLKDCEKIYEKIQKNLC